MAYTNETANKVFDLAHTELGWDASYAVALAFIVTADDEVLQNLSESNLEAVKGSIAELETTIAESHKIVKELLGK